jgi:SAM-dependent methyltransferase
MSEIDPPGTYRPQYRFRGRTLVRLLDHAPWLKTRLADMVRRLFTRLFEPGLVTTERVLEYPFVFQHLGQPHGAVLDLGSCSSRFPIALASRGIRTIAFDVNSYHHRHPNLVAIRGNAMRLPFIDRSLAGILAVSVIEHIGLGHYGDPKMQAGDARVVREIARVLRPGGRALITVPFGLAMTDHFQRVYSAVRLKELLQPLEVIQIEHAWSRQGLWTPCTEGEAATVDWNGTSRAVALVVATASSSHIQRVSDADFGG